MPSPDYKYRWSYSPLLLLALQTLCLSKCYPGYSATLTLVTVRAYMRQWSANSGGMLACATVQCGPTFDSAMSTIPQISIAQWPCLLNSSKGQRPGPLLWKSSSSDGLEGTRRCHQDNSVYHSMPPPPCFFNAQGQIGSICDSSGNH